MANWSDPRQNAAPFATAAAARGEAYDAGLRSYMLSVYNYMASGVLLTGIVALLFANSSLINLIATVNPATGLIVLRPSLRRIATTPKHVADPRGSARWMGRKPISCPVRRE